MPDALLDRLHLRPGSMADYAAVAVHHYRGGRPGAPTRVLTLEDTQPGPADRFVKRAGRRRVVGVLVEALPMLGCALRQQALGDRYQAGLSPRQRARLLNSEVRCIARVVIEPQWRGLGLAVRLVRAALASPTTPITEALAAMGHVSPFFEKAGMTAYRRPPHAHDARLLDALRYIGLPLHAEPNELAQLTGDAAAMLDRELTRWARHHPRVSQKVDPADALMLAQQKIGFAPVYYVKCHATSPLEAAADSTSTPHHADMPQAT